MSGSEPLWWAAARRLKARGLALEAIATRLGRSLSGVRYALDPARRESENRRRRGRPITGPGNAPARRKLVRAARAEAEAAGRHVDDVLIGWGLPARRQTAAPEARP